MGVGVGAGAGAGAGAGLEEVERNGEEAETEKRRECGRNKDID